MPTPEPITTPSMSETVGLMKHSSCQLSAYSAASDLIASALRLLPHSVISRTSPPAQKARSVAEPDHHRVDLRIARPAGERGGHGGAHGRVERVERRRPIQGDQACRVVLAQDDVGRRISRRAQTCICSRFPVFHWFFFHRLFPIFAINFWILTLATISGYI